MVMHWSPVIIKQAHHVFQTFLELIHHWSRYGVNAPENTVTFSVSDQTPMCLDGLHTFIWSCPTVHTRSSLTTVKTPVEDALIQEPSKTACTSPTGLKVCSIKADRPPVLKPKTESLFRSDHREVMPMRDVSNDDLLDWYFAELIKELIFCTAVLEIWFDWKKKKKDKILQSEHILKKAEKNDHYFK